MSYADKVRAGTDALRGKPDGGNKSRTQVILDAVNVRALVEALKKEHDCNWVKGKPCSVCALIAEWSE